MAYSIAADVESEFKNIEFSTDTFITLSDIDSFIMQADALINANVGMRYQIPVSADSDALALLKLYSITLVADRIKKILGVKQVTNTDANQDVRGVFTSKDVIKALQDLKNGNMLLSGATLLQSPGGFSSYTEEHKICPTWKKDSVQW